jgi:hypothetical protein
MFIASLLGNYTKRLFICCVILQKLTRLFTFQRAHLPKVPRVKVNEEVLDVLFFTSEIGNTCVGVSAKVPKFRNGIVCCRVYKFMFISQQHNHIWINFIVNEPPCFYPGPLSLNTHPHIRFPEDKSYTDTRKPATNPHTTGSCKLNRTTWKITARPCLRTICTISTYKDIRNFNHAQCNSLMMDTQYPKYVGEERTTVCFMF